MLNGTLYYFRKTLRRFAFWLCHLTYEFYQDKKKSRSEELKSLAMILSVKKKKSVKTCKNLQKYFIIFHAEEKSERYVFTFKRKRRKETGKVIINRY